MLIIDGASEDVDVDANAIVNVDSGSDIEHTDVEHTNL